MNNSSETIVTCPNCGQRNRIPKGYAQQKKRPICAKCWTSLVSSEERQDVPPPPKPDIPIEEQTKRRPLRGSFSRGWAFFLILIVGIVYWSALQDSPKTNKKAAALKKRPQSVSLQYPEQPMPSNGAIQTFTAKECIAPLEIRGGSGSHYLVKLVDVHTGFPVITVFVRSGSTTTVDVPIGSYELRYAAGKKWYGYRYLFGPTTSYSKADKTFEFVDSGYQVSGYTVTLYRVPYGNLSTSSIDASQF